MKIFGWALFIFVALALVVLLNKPASSAYATIPLSDFTSRLDSDLVKVVEVRHDELIGEFKSTETIGGDKVQKFRVVLPEGSTASWNFTPWLVEHRQNATVLAQNEPNLLLNILVPLIPWLLIFGFIWFFVFRQLRKSQNTKVGDAIKVFVVNLPGEPPLANEAPKS
jgi:ATP-dependent Zn protease